MQHPLRDVLHDSYCSPDAGQDSRRFLTGSSINSEEKIMIYT
jgi:hypothetical protein